MSTVDLTKWELHNCRPTPDGLRTRAGFVSVASPTAGTEYVGGFSVESPSTTEVWHYLFEQSTTTNVTTLRVYTEEFREMFSQDLGPLQKRPAISYAVALGQMFIGSPAFSSMLYGLPGGGIITAHKTASINPDTTALEIPTGHVCAFGDRFVIAQGNVLFFNDPPLANSVDPRTFVAQNAFAMNGTVYDLFQGTDGNLYIFTSDGVFTLPPDAIAQGQSPAGYLSRVPGVEVSRPRNAVGTTGAIAVLQKDHILLLPSGQRIDLVRRAGPRYTGLDVAVEDLRLAGELSATPTGFVVGFRAMQSFFLEGDIPTKSYGYHYGTPGGAISFQVVAMLRSRDNAPIYVMPANVFIPHTREVTEPTGQMFAIASGRVALSPKDNPVVRRVTIESDAWGNNSGVVVDGSTPASVRIPTRTTDAIVGTALWDDAAPLVSKHMRSVRHNFSVRSADPGMEIRLNGNDVLLGAEIDVETSGQGGKRADRQ